MHVLFLKDKSGVSVNKSHEKNKTGKALVRLKTLTSPFIPTEEVNLELKKKAHKYVVSFS